MIIPKPFEAAPVPVGDPSRETIEYAPTSSVHPIPVTNVLVAGTTIFTVPIGEYWEIIGAAAFNIDGSSADSVTAHIIQQGGSASAANSIFRTSISAFNSVEMAPLIGLILGPETSVRCFTANNDVNVSFGIKRHFRGSRRD